MNLKSAKVINSEFPVLEIKNFLIQQNKNLKELSK